MNEREPDDKERREAEALARALEGDGSPEDIPAEALESAALLRRASGDGTLSDAQRRAILERIAPEEDVRQVRRGRLRWLVPVGSVTVVLLVAAVWFFGGAVDRRAAGPAPPARLPSPGPALLTAQARAATGTPNDLSSLGRDMSAYRRRLYLALAARYQERS